MLLTTLGASAYVLGSYALMQRHTAARPLWTTLREGLREACYVLATQPVAPLFYLLGQRLGCKKKRGRPVIFVHGYGQNRACFWWLARQLRRRGVGPLHGFNYPWFLGIHHSAERLSAFIDQVLRDSGHDEVDLVGHSMGGLVALDHLRRAGGHARVRRCVTVASPHAGVAWEGPIPGLCGPQLRRGSPYLQELAASRPPVPLLSVYSTHDNIVHPPNTSSLADRGGRDACLPSGGHLSLLFSGEVVDLIHGFLNEPEPALVAEVAVDELAPPSSSVPSGFGPRKGSWLSLAA